MHLQDAEKCLRAYIAADIPCFLWGAPGIGKSDVVRAVASDSALNIGKSDATRSGSRLPLIDLRAILLDPVDLRGLPSAKDGRAVWLPPEFLPDEARDGEQGILFLDELNAAPASVQAACFQLVLDRRVGEYRLPKGWRIVAAGNRASDRAAAQRMPSALANRFAHIDCEASPEAWQAWAVKAGISPMVRAFLKFRPALLHSMETKPGVDLRAFPTPRSWSRVSDIATQPESIRMHLVSGLVGEAAASEFEGFVRVASRLPSLAAIVQDPHGAPVPSDPSSLYAVATMLAHGARRENLAAILDYASRLPREYDVVTATDALQRDRGLSETAAFAAWAIRNKDVNL